MTNPDSKDSGETSKDKPLSFKEKMALQREKAMAEMVARPPAPPRTAVPELKAPMPRAFGRSLEDDIEGLETLIDECDITPWEVGFCKSCLRQLKTPGSGGLSVKQAVIVDKLAAQYLEGKGDGSDPTPHGNPPMQKATKEMQKPSQTFKNPIRFDDIDDDIPF